MTAKRRPAPADFLPAAECLKVIAHPQRLFLLHLLEQGEYTVGELAEACDIPSHMASEHLRLMMRCGLLRVASEGRKRFYTVSEPHVKTILNCIEERFL